jgi:polysaccharide export outer membrane protein
MLKYLLGIPFLSAVRSAAVAAGLLLLFGCASDQPHASAAPSASTGSGPLVPITAIGGTGESVDALRVGELIVIEFSGPELPPPRHEERIKTDGRVTLPSIGPVQAAGKTRGDLEQTIHDLYVPNYYTRLTVTVRNEGRFFYVKGQVKNPNQFPYLKEMTVLKAIATAGDFTDFAKKSKVLVTRADGRKVTVNCIKALRDNNLDLPIYPDDTIEVPRRYF